MNGHRYLGLDLGERHVGVAISDPDTHLVFPRPSLDIHSDEECLSAITTIVVTEKPDAVILGLPLTLRGDVGQQAAKVETFAEKLRPRIACPVHLVDERLTTAGTVNDQSNVDDHAGAARLILETFIATNP